MSAVSAPLVTRTTISWYAASISARGARVSQLNVQKPWWLMFR
jgi:hypothetical protein